MEQFEKGDIVKGNKHPHLMTVKTIDNGVAVCNYFVEKELFEEAYSLENLILKPMKECLELPIEVLIEEDDVIIGFTEEAVKLLGPLGAIYSCGKSFEEAEKELWHMFLHMQLITQERSRELNKYKWFQKGPWGIIGGNWFTILGISVYFRYGKGMKGGWYIPFTNLNISITNYWLKEKIKSK